MTIINNAPDLLMRFTTTLLAVLSCTCIVAAQSADDGWKSLVTNDFTDARTAFLLETRSNPRNARTWFGKSMEEEFRNDNDAAWLSMVEALRSVDTLHPYLYAVVSSEPFRSATSRRHPDVEKLLRAAIDKPDATGVMWATAVQRLGSYEATRQNISAAQTWYDRLGAITTWRIVGPFDNISNSGHDRRFGPEESDEPTAVYSSAEGGELRWSTPPNQRRDAWIDMTYFTPRIEGQYYAVVYVKSPSQQRVQLRLGTSGSFKLFLNDTVVREDRTELNNDIDTYITECTLAQGWNKVMVKLGASRIDDSNFLLRLTSSDGMPVRGLEYSTLPQSFVAVAPAPRQIAHPYTTFFQQRVAQQPDEVLNYLLLADVFLHNDQADSALAVMRAVRPIASDCILAHIRSMIAYARTDQKSARESILEHIIALKPRSAFATSQRFTRAIEQQKLEDADRELTEYRWYDTTSKVYYDHRIALALARKEYDDVTSLVSQARVQFPEIPLYALIASNIAESTTNPAERPIDILEQHLSYNTTFEGLNALVALHLKQSNIPQVLACYDRQLQRIPVGCGIHSKIADMYMSRNEWSRALASIDNALVLSPMIPSFWMKRGVIYQNMSVADSAIASYRRCLAIDPASFEAREAIRRLQGKPHPFTYMPSVNVDSLIRIAPSARDYPGESIVTVYEGSNDVVYDGSRGEYMYESLSRVLTPDGIDDATSIPIPSEVTVEKAVVRKPNGREIPADQGPGQLVFTGLEPGDFVYYRIRSQVVTRGRLGRHYSRKFALSFSSSPAKHIRFALLTPPDMPFSWVGHGLETEMKASRNSYGDLYVWESRNEPRISLEDDMPEIEDVQKQLDISTLSSWEEIISWYDDVSRSATESTYELRAVVDSLLPRSYEFTRNKIIEAVYTYITREIRYSYVPFRQSGYIPQHSRTVLNTRIGDCKDVAMLCIAMLKERGIPAYPVLVNTETSLFARRPMPGIVFDHVIVMIPGDPMPLFLDLTADGVPIGNVPYADRNAFALVIRRGLREPMFLTKMYFRPNVLEMETTITVDADNNARITQLTRETGSSTAAYRRAWRNTSSEKISQSITEMLSEVFPNVMLDSYEHADLTTLDSTFWYKATFTVPNFLAEAGDFLIARVPWEQPFTPLSALSYPSRQHPMSFTSGYDSTSEVVTMNIPAGYVVSERDGNAQVDCQQFTYNRTSTAAKDALILRRSSAQKFEVVDVDAYAEFKSNYNRAVKEDRRSILFMPRGTKVTVPAKRKQK